MVNEQGFQALAAVKEALGRVENRHLDSASVSVLHGRLAAAVAANRDLLTDDQFQALGGGTPKPPAS